MSGTKTKAADAASRISATGVGSSAHVSVLQEAHRTVLLESEKAEHVGLRAASTLAEAAERQRALAGPFLHFLSREELKTTMGPSLLQARDQPPHGKRNRPA